jgi:hypothetical protein
LRARQVEPDPGVGDAHVLAPHLIIAQPHLADPRRLVFRRMRKIALAAEELALRAQHLVIHQVRVVGAQDLARGLRQIEHNPLVLHHDQLG